MFTFGLQPPEGHVPAHWWGARAIFSHGWDRPVGSRDFGKAKRTTTIDLLPDRQSFAGDRGEAEKDFLAWINGVGLPAVRKWADRVQTDSRERFDLEQDGYAIAATPNGSHGYLYIGAWTKAPKDPAPAA